MHNFIPVKRKADLVSYVVGRWSGSDVSLYSKLPHGDIAMSWKPAIKPALCALLLLHNSEIIVI